MDFEADKMVNLLQYCCWKARCTMDKNGFRELARKIAERAEKKSQLPDERYLVDLYAAANTAMQQNNFIGRHQTYIDPILQYARGGHWDDWKHSLALANEYVQPGSLELIGFSVLGLAICFPQLLEKQLLPDLSPVKRIANYPLDLLSCKSDTISENLGFALKQLETFPFLIWAIPVSWNEQLTKLKNPGWNELLETKRIVPVWVEENDPWGNTPFIPWLNHQQTIGNLPGLFSSLLCLQDAIQKYHQPPEPSKPSQHLASRIQNIPDNRGTLFLGDNVQITGENFYQGTIHQTIYKHKKDDHEH